MAHYSIKDVESLSGVKAHTLRIWEQRYNFLKPQRTPTNIRYYTDEQLRSILNISTLNRHGWRISQIVQLTTDELQRQVLELSDATSTTDEQTAQLIRAMVEFDEALFEKTVQQAVIKHGIEQAFTEVFFPFMERTGVLWATGSVCPSQEHFVSNLFRRKLCVAIDGCVARQSESARRYVLFAPEHDEHELLLLYIELLLRKAGQKVVYIGAATPLADAPRIREHFRPHHLVVAITSPPPAASLDAYLNDLSRHFADSEIWVCGVQLKNYVSPLPARVKIVQSSQQIRQEIDLLSV